MPQEDVRNEICKGIAKKRNYGSPTLVCFGRVAELTLAGGTSPSETATGNGGCSNTPGRKSCIPSDPCTKQNIARIGTHPFGIGIYLFDYKPEFQAEWGLGRQFGVMADEVETVMPEAICVHAKGYRMVDYAMLGVEHSVH